MDFRNAVKRGVLVSAAVSLLAGGSAEALADSAGRSASPYLSFATQTVDMLLEKESRRLGDRPDGVPFLVVTRNPIHAWVSLGYVKDGKFAVTRVPECGLDPEPFVVDFRAWRMLQQLSRQTGDPRYSDSVKDMAEAFAEYGFHPRSGLPVASGMFDFDIRTAGPVGGVLGRRKGSTPSFKPNGAMHWESLWQAAPEKMSRFCRATFLGLVTRPCDMRFNRYVTLDFSDRNGQHVLSFKPGHRGFLLTGAFLIRFWAMEYLYSGSEEALDWAVRMARMWQGLQNRKTGLAPHFIGADSADDTEQRPAPFANKSDDYSAVVLVEVAQMIADVPACRELAAILRDVGTRLALGIATEAYDPQNRLFENWLNLDGGAFTGRAYYTFHDQAAKEAAMKIDSVAKQIEVFAGPGFFRGPRRSWTCGTRLPKSIARVAELTRDPALLRRAVYLAEEMLKEVDTVDRTFNDRGQWVYPATAGYIKMFLSLYHATEDRRWLDHALDLADRSIKVLERDVPEGQAPWWRLPYRTAFLQVLLDLDAALRPGTPGLHRGMSLPKKTDAAGAGERPLPTYTRAMLKSLTKMGFDRASGTAEMAVANESLVPFSVSLKWDLTQAAPWKVEPQAATVDLDVGAQAPLTFKLVPPATGEIYPVPVAVLTILCDGRSVREFRARPPVRNRPSARVPRLALPEKLTGTPSARVRRGGAALRLVYGPYAQVRKTYAASAWLAWSDRGLYVAYECPDPDVKNAYSKATERDAPNVWEDDCVELFLDIRCDRENAKQFISTVRGVAYDTAIRDVKGRTKWLPFDGKWQHVVSVTKDGWTAEMLIPWEDLGLDGPPKPGHRMGCNLTRMKRLPEPPAEGGGVHHYSVWAVPFGWNTEVSSFGTLILE